MTCTDCQERLLEGLARDAATATHLSACAECRAFSAALAVADAQLTATLAGAAAPPGFEVSVRRRIRAEAPPSWLPEILDFLGLAGSAVLAGAARWAFVPAPWRTATTLLSAGGAVLAAGAWFGLRALSDPV